MLDDESTPTPEETPETGANEESTPAPAPDSTNTDSTNPASQDAPAGPAKKTAKKAVKKSTAKKSTTKKAAAKRTTKKAAASPPQAPEVTPEPEGAAPAADTAAPTAGGPSAQEPAEGQAAEAAEPTQATEPTQAGEPPPAAEPDLPAAQASEAPPAAPPAAALLFQPPDPSKVAPPPRRSRKQAEEPEPEAAEGAEPEQEQQPGADTEGSQRRRRRRGGRRRRKNGNGEDGGDEATPDETSEQAAEPAPTAAEDEGAEKSGSSSSRRRRRRRRRPGEEDSGAPDDPDNTVVRVREPRQVSDEISGVTGSTRLEAKKQRRREGREAGRRRAPIVSEAEFLARREAVDRVMVVRQRDDVTQIGVLEDDVLVEHYVARESQTSLIGNVYLGRVQNVLPSMEAAFVDIGKGRNAVLYAGEVNWSLLGKEGQPRRIESALKSGQTVLVQVTKDPVGHKGARLTSQISLPGRYLVYMPGGQTSGISRKLPDTERNRLKNLLKEILPDEAGVIIRTAAEGASEDELRRDVARLTARWDDIEKKVEKGQAPQLLYGEPDLMIKVVRDLFTEDFKKLVISGDDAWDMIEGYVSHVAPDLMERVERWTDDKDVFASYRLDEQIAKALDRKVWLPSGGSLIIDRTEAMTVVDVNTGKFTGSGGNLEETVTKNNLEAAEEMVRQLRLRDIGGIIVIDFIDMVLESNRDLVLRRLIECLGRDRTRHQVAEVTSLGLVQMTRKRIGTGLLEAFSEPCESCGGRGLHTHLEPVEKKPGKESEDSRRGGRRSRRSGDGADKQPEKKPDQGKKQAGKQPEKGDTGDEGDKGKKTQEPKADKGKRKDTPRKDTQRKDTQRQDQAPAAEAVPAEPAQPEPAQPEPAGPERATALPAEAPTDTSAPRSGMAQPAAAPATVPSAEGSAPSEARVASASTAPAAGSTGDGSSEEAPARPARRTRRRAASRPAGPPEHSTADAR